MDQNFQELLLTIVRTINLLNRSEQLSEDSALMLFVYIPPGVTVVMDTHKDSRDPPQMAEGPLLER